MILASSSPYRANLLRQLGLTFDTFSPQVDETAKHNEPAHELAGRLAAKKAAAVAAHCAQGLIIGSDQVAQLVLPDQPAIHLGKPGSIEKAIHQLSQCSGQSVTFYTGLSVLDAQTRQQITQCETFTVQFRQLSLAQIERYVEKEQPLDCAGSFKCEGLGIRLFESMQGSDPNSLIGLPLIALTSILLEFGVDPLFRDPACLNLG
ncbi:septum formation inhibitor Maf [Alteromonas sp. SM 2104]|nr:septum formation inhibitor Maf [Alteromonas oceanisediminis]